MSDVQEATFACQYCEKSFKREHTLAVHMCEPKRRFSEKTEKGVQLGLHTYNKFYQYTQDRNKTKSFDEFAKSPYYKAFVKFGRYVVNTKCINIERFVHFVITSGIKLDNWATDRTYTAFIEDLIINEPVSDALTRSIECSIAWAQERNMEAHDILRFGTDSVLCHYITQGKLSPWALYQSDSGQAFLGRLTPENTKIIFDMINPDLWYITFSRGADDVEFAQDMLKQAGW